MPEIGALPFTDKIPPAPPAGNIGAEVFIRRQM
jgi:hypothetical protein